MSVSPTTKKFKKASKKFDASVFERELSKGELGLDAALEHLRTALYTGVAADVFCGLLSKPHLLEYALSILDDGLTEMLRKELLAGFDRDGCVACPSPAPVLKRLSEFFCFLPYPSDDVKPKSLTEDYQFVSRSQEALLALATAGFIQLGSASFPQKDEDEVFLKTARRPSSAKQMKRAKRSRADTLNIERKPFDNLKEQVPSTQSEAHELALRLLARQKELFGRYVDLLKDPALSEIIRERYMPKKIDTTVLNSSNAPQSESSDSPAEARTVDDKPSAYPRIQPYKASLYFDNADGFGEWRIYMSTTALKDLRTYSREPAKFSIIDKKLRELSNGIFSDDNQKRLKGPDKGIPIYEVRLSGRLTGDLRLIYQIDVLSDLGNLETQGIRVYGIFTHAQMDDRMWASLSAQLAVRGPEYRKRVAFRKARVPGDRVFLPHSWPDVSYAEAATEDADIKPLVNPADLEQIHKWLVLEKYSAFSQTLLNWILGGRDASPVFTVSPHERAIIEHPSSCYVLGRSGTGKTTTMVFKIFGVERTAETRLIQLDTDTKPRQLFVTQSHVLASRVREYYIKLSEFLSAAAGVPLPPSTGKVEAEEGLGDPENDEEWRSDLPKRFSDLQESHFPLFLTFDKLCRLVEEDMGVSFTRPRYTKEHRRAESRYKLGNAVPSFELNDVEDDVSSLFGDIKSYSEATCAARVTFESFLNNYWPHFPQDLKKHLDPALVFSEFLGVIKGSHQSLKSESNYLSREEYLGLSERTQSTFATQREKIYCLFEKYTALKREYGDYDLADRCHVLLRCLKDDYKFPVDFLYIDEAQDNLVIDAFLLRRLCRNPHGLFWAGDTAQTIAIGSSFRFEDLKAALHDFERELYPSVSKKILVQPSFFQLTTNYRSHGGIVDCAGLIIDLIKHFWSHSIDALGREKGLVDGSKPIFFTGWDDETARYEQFLLGEKGDAVDFGAQQCILVRNDQARNELRKQVGEIGVILTLYESKGLEFDDVLLYDFFKDSPYALSQWRMVLNFLPERDETKTAVPRFNEVRHAGICTELKFLYVAITRARKNLWIIDRSEKGEPMKNVLLELGRIEIRSPEQAPKLARTSTSDEWAETGKLLFRNQRYPQAMRCFERAGLHIERAIAEAFHFRHEARNVPRAKNEQIRNEAFIKAAHAFLNCAKKSLTSYKKYFHIAAECFREAHANNQAASAYENAEEYTSAAIYYVKAVMFDDAVRIVKVEVLDRDAAERIVGAARLHYIHVEKLDKAMDLFVSQEEGLEFLEDCGFDTARAMVLERIGLFREAADAYFRDGHEQQAIRLLLKDTQNPQSVQCGADYLLKSLWSQYSFGVKIESDDANAESLVGLARAIDKSLLSAHARSELKMFDAISGDDKALLLRAYNQLLMTRNQQAAVLVLDHILRGEQKLYNAQGTTSFLRACLNYAALLKRVWNDANLAEQPGIMQLFGVRKVSEDEFLLVNGSFLASEAIKGYHASLRTLETGIVLALHDLLRLIKSSVRTRLFDVVQSQVAFLEGIRNKLFGDPCLAHAIQGQCNRMDCHRQHIDLKSVDSTWFNARVQIHLLQIRFLQTADFALQQSFRTKVQHDWITNLFNVLHPSLLVLGSVVNISRDFIPEYEEGMATVSLWIENRTYQMHPNYISSWWFLNAVTEVAALASWQDCNKAKKLMHRARFYTGETIIPALRETLERSRIPDLVTSFDPLDPNVIRSGCAFIKHVIQYRLTIDVGYLCRITELLCAASVLLYKNSRGSFHDCLLPRSWLSYLLPRLNFDQEYDIKGPIWVLFGHCADLASYMIISSDQEISHLRNASTRIVRNLSIQRICRAMSLVGCNTTRGLRGFVIMTVSKLRAVSSYSVPDLLRPYLLTNGWKGLRRAAENSIPVTGLDELIQLVQIGHKPMQCVSDAKIRQVTFKDKEGLLSYFAISRKEDFFKLSATAKEFTPGSLPVSVPTADAGENQLQSTTHEDTDFADEADEHSEDEDDGDEDNLLNRPSVAELDDQPSNTITFDITGKHKAAAYVILRSLRTVRDRKERAARTLQRRYRAILAHRAEMEEPGIHGKRARFYTDCLAIDARRNGQWPSGHHRIVFLGVVPDLLVCLDALQLQVQSNKDGAKKQISLKKKSTQVDYDEVSLRLTRAIDDRKHLEQLKKTLDVKSEWHAKRTTEELQSLVQEVVDFSNQLKITGDVLGMCSRARDLINGTKMPEPKKKGKPKLNVDDDLDVVPDDMSIVSD